MSADAPPPTPRGVLTVSLDFELYWGIRDKVALERCREHLLRAREVVPALLELFEEFEVHATWATVGFLFFQSREELLAGLPAQRPEYADPRFSPYPHLEQLGPDEERDPFHYAASLIEQIAQTPHQEIASHTFGHYYCLERGQSLEAFRADLQAAHRAAERRGVELSSLVFPRNQCSAPHLAVCREEGFRAYRGNPPSRLYRAKNEADESLLRRGLRVFDAYLNLSGHGAYALAELGRAAPVDLRASRFLRPYVPGLGALEPLRRRRVAAGLRHAAERGLVYHLWWHPHNFGRAPEKNLAFLRRVLERFAELRERRGMESLNMRELAERVRGEAAP